MQLAAELARASDLRAAHPALAHVPQSARARRGTATSAGCCWRGRATAGRARTGALVLRARRRGAVRPRRLQRDRAVRPLRPGAARDRDGRRRDPRADRRGRGDAGAGRGQRARADRLRRRPLRLGHDGLHDAEVPLAGDRAVRRATACCRCSATTGRPRATSSGATARARGSCSRRATRAGSGRRACATSSTASSRAASRSIRPEHAYHALEIMLAAKAAAADGRAREIASDFPRPELAAWRCSAGRAPRPRPALDVDLGRLRWHASRWPTSAAARRAAPARWRASSTRARTSRARRSCSIDLDPERLDLIRRLAERMVKARGPRPHDRGDDR